MYMLSYLKFQKPFEGRWDIFTVLLSASYRQAEKRCLRCYWNYVHLTPC